MGSEFGNSIYLDFQLAELQLLVTQSCTTLVIFSARSSGSWIPYCPSWQTTPNFTGRWILTSQVLPSCLVDETQLAPSRTVEFFRCHAKDLVVMTEVHPVHLAVGCHVTVWTVWTIHYLGNDVSLRSGFNGYTKIPIIHKICRKFTYLNLAWYSAFIRYYDPWWQHSRLQ
jgi:hypothetical protein